jgi:hypothetical protein
MKFLQALLLLPNWEKEKQKKGAKRNFLLLKERERGFG